MLAPQHNTVLLKRDRWIPGIGASVGIVLAFALYRHGRLIGFDPYYYCELAKAYTHSWPPSFGNSWPCGYPLLGGLLARVGISIYAAFCLIGAASITTLAVLSARLLAGTPFLAFIVTAMCATPVIGVQLFGAMTELPFSACWLGLACCLAAWPGRRAIWLASGLGVVALCLRYAGGIALGLVWLWILLRDNPLKANGRKSEAILAALTMTAVCAGLLLWNFLTTGHLSGADRASLPPTNLQTWIHEAADFGWAMPAALMLGGVRVALDGHPPAETAAGLLLLCIPMAIFIWGWRRPSREWVQPVALTGAIYILGMIALRAIGSFDALYNARTFLPAVFPMGVVLAIQTQDKSVRLLLASFSFLLLCGIVSAVRGVSRQIDADVRPAVAKIQDLLKPGDSVQINDEAFSTAAYLSVPVERAWPQFWNRNPVRRFLIVAAKPLDRAGTPGIIDPAWNSLLAHLVANGSHRFLLQTPGLVVLERIDPSVP